LRWPSRGCGLGNRQDHAGPVAGDRVMIALSDAGLFAAQRDIASAEPRHAGWRRKNQQRPPDPDLVAGAEMYVSARAGIDVVPLALAEVFEIQSPRLV